MTKRHFDIIQCIILTKKLKYVYYSITINIINKHNCMLMLYAYIFVSRQTTLCVHVSYFLFHNLHADQACKMLEKCDTTYFKHLTSYI